MLTINYVSNSRDRVNAYLDDSGSERSEGSDDLVVFIVVRDERDVSLHGSRADGGVGVDEARLEEGLEDE